MKRHLPVFAVFTAATFLSYFFQLGNAVISPDLSADLDLSAAELGLMSGAFFATFAAMQIPLGIGLDRWGPRWVVSGLLLIGVAGSLLFAAAPSLPVLTLGRGLMGIGMASILMGSLKAFSQWYPPERFATMSGLLMGIGSLGAFFAATPLAWLNGQFGWRAVFVAMALVAFGVALMIAVYGRNPPVEVDIPLSETRPGGVRQVLGDRRFWRIIPASLFVAGTGFAFQGLWAGPYLFDNYGLNQVEVGNTLSFIALGSTIGALSSGWLADRFDLVRMIALDLTLFILAQLALAFHPSLAVIGVLFFLLGFTAASTILIFAHVRRLFPDELTGQALSTTNLFMFAGIFLLQGLIGVVIGLFAVDADGSSPARAYTIALLMTAFFNVLAVVIYFPFIRLSKRHG
jgi:MFS family permease